MLKIKQNQSHRLTISLVINNGEKYLPHCLDSLAQQTYSDFLLLIIDNASIDNSKLALERWFLDNPILRKRSRVIVNKKNLGFCRGHNQSWQWSGGEYFFILNQDVILKPNYIAELINFLDKDKEVSSVQGKILTWNFAATQNYQKDLSKKLHSEEFIDTCGLRIYRNRRVVNIAQGEKDIGQFKKPFEIFGVVGTAAIYRRQCLEVVKIEEEIFDENFFAYKEDIDLAWRLRSVGFSAFCLPSAVAYHDRSLREPASLWQLIKTRWRWSKNLKLYSYRNHWLTVIKNDSIYFWKDILHISWFEFKKLGYMIIFEPLILLRAWVYLTKLLNSTLKKRKQLRRVNQVEITTLRKWFI